MKVFFSFTFILVFLLNTGELTSAVQPPYELVVKDTSGGPTSPKILVVKEAQTLKEFYREVNKTRRPGLAIPNVDFNNEFIVILCMGTVMTIGHEVTINDIKKSANGLTVFVEETRPDEKEKLAKVRNEPFSVYRIKGNYKNVRFEKRTP